MTSMPTTPSSAPRAGERAHAPALALAAGALLLVAGVLGGCSLDRIAGSSMPVNVPDPGPTHSALGAMNAFRGALLDFRTWVGGDYNSYIPVGGLLTDELGSADISSASFAENDDVLIDSRNLLEGSGTGPIDTLYSGLQQTRGQTEEARGLVEAYDPDSTAIVGYLDLLQGYTEVYLADLFCSGVPLSTLDYNGNYTLKPGSTTQQVYADAAAQFDSAMTLAVDSAHLLNAARVGEARAQLDLGNYAAAASVASQVPDGFTFALRFSTFSPATNLPGNSGNRNFSFGDFLSGASGAGTHVTMSNDEGGNGLPFRASNDPRTAWAVNGASGGFTLYRPKKYGSLLGTDSIVIASAVEARLIEAEVALQAHDTATWLHDLNALRTDSTQAFGVWNAGTGAVKGLAPLTDPGTDSGRVDLTFRERAFWLYLTGERQGDLRRLIRQYGRDPNAVYPTGVYNGAAGSYGNDVTAPIPESGRGSKPLFTGCFNRGA